MPANQGSIASTPATRRGKDLPISKPDIFFSRLSANGVSLIHFFVARASICSIRWRVTPRTAAISSRVCDAVSNPKRLTRTLRSRSVSDKRDRRVSTSIPVVRGAISIAGSLIGSSLSTEMSFSGSSLACLKRDTQGTVIVNYSLVLVTSRVIRDARGAAYLISRHALFLPPDAASAQSRHSLFPLEKKSH